MMHCDYVVAGLRGIMPTYGLRTQAERFLRLAIKAQEDGRGVDCSVLTKRAVEHLHDALAVEELSRKIPAETPRLISDV